MPTHPEFPATTSARPIIGVFDSGFGGLTVLRALLSTIPGAHFIYLGDTARLPYGAKSRATVARYAVESARLLESRGAELLVIACNTATALALDDIRSAVRVPVIGVIEPGARATAEAIRSSQSDPATALGAPSVRVADGWDQNPPNASAAPPEVLVLATAATVQSHAYHAACASLGLAATEKACPLLVPLVEEGWVHHPVTREVIRIYLREAFEPAHPAAFSSAARTTRSSTPPSRPKSAPSTPTPSSSTPPRPPPTPLTAPSRPYPSTTSPPPPPPSSASPPTPSKSSNASAATSSTNPSPKSTSSTSAAKPTTPNAVILSRRRRISVFFCDAELFRFRISADKLFLRLSLTTNH